MVQYSIPVTYIKGDRFIQPDGAENDYSHAPRPFYSLGYVKRGGARFVCEGKEYPLERGDVVFVPKRCRYRSYWGAHGETEVISCFFDVVPYGEPIGNRFYPMQKIAHCEELLPLFEDLLREGKTPNETLLSLGHLFELLARLFERMCYNSSPVDNERILRAVRHIESHYNIPLQVAELASLCHISPSHFYECFKREMGVSPIEYKNRVMIRHAERALIDSPKASIEEISEKLGFESSIYFRRLFKAKTGMTPREYRKRAERGF